jgi:hypothetical protein
MAVYPSDLGVVSWIQAFDGRTQFPISAVNREAKNSEIYSSLDVWIPHVGHVSDFQ